MNEANKMLWSLIEKLNYKTIHIQTVIYTGLIMLLVYEIMLTKHFTHAVGLAGVISLAIIERVHRNHDNIRNIKQCGKESLEK